MWKGRRWTKKRPIFKKTLILEQSTGGTEQRVRRWFIRRARLDEVHEPGEPLQEEEVWQVRPEKPLRRRLQQLPVSLACFEARKINILCTNRANFWPPSLAAFVYVEDKLFEYQSCNSNLRQTELSKCWQFICCNRHFPTYLPTHLPTYLPTYRPTYLPTYLPTYCLQNVGPKFCV